jgi:glycosidase
MDVVRYVDPDFWNDFRRVTKNAKPDCLLLAEIMGDASPWLQGDRFDATMNYTFRDLLVEFLARGSMGSATFADGLARLFHQYAESATEVNQNLIGSHDKQRFLTAAGGETWRLVLATVVQMTFPGAPGIYYGDEIGMTGANDPHCRATFRWDPATWNREVFEATAALGLLRRDSAVLRRGAWSVLWTGGEALAYERRLGEERVVVVLNRGEALDRVRVEWAEGGQPVVLWGHATVEHGEGTLVVGLAARSAVVLGGPTGDRSPESGTVAADG